MAHNTPLLRRPGQAEPPPDSSVPVGLRLDLFSPIVASLLILLFIGCITLFVLQDRLAGYVPTISETFVGWPNSALSSIVFAFTGVILCSLLTLWTSAFDSWQLLNRPALSAARLLSGASPLFQTVAGAVTMADSVFCHFFFLSLALVSYAAFFAIVVVATRSMVPATLSYARWGIVATMAAALLGLWTTLGAGGSAASTAAAVCEGLCVLALIAFLCTFRFEIPAFTLSVVLLN
jgi:hypothetical protein